MSQPFAGFYQLTFQALRIFSSLLDLRQPRFNNSLSVLQLPKLLMLEIDQSKPYPYHTHGREHGYQDHLIAFVFGNLSHRTFSGSRHSSVNCTTFFPSTTWCWLLV